MEHILNKEPLIGNPVVRTYVRSTSTIEPKNASNKYERYNFDKSKYLRFEGESNVDEEFEHIAIAASLDFNKNRKTLDPTNRDPNDVVRYDYQRRNNQGPGIFSNRLGPVSINGYSTYADEYVGEFFFAAYKAAKSIGIVEPKLLVNHMFNQPESQIIYMRSDYKRDLPVNQVADIFQEALLLFVAKIKLEQLKVKAKMTTSDGPPYRTANGEYYDPNAITFGSIEDANDEFISALKKDYFSIKKGWFPKIEEIYFNQWDFDPYSITPDNFLHYYENCILICGDRGYRLNSIDSVINHEELRSHRDMMLTKDRKFMYIDNKGVHWGTIDNKRLTEMAIAATGVRWGGATNRKRLITRAGFVANLPSMVITKMVTNFIEESVNSFASLRPKVIDGYKEFLLKCNYKSNGVYHFINGDRSNAESFVTTNYKQFLELIPPSWRKLYKNQTTVCIFGKAYYAFQGLSSGIAKTTELNWIMGTFEAINAIAKLINQPVRAVAVNYFNSVILEKPFFEMGDYIIKLFMCTDDIPLVIYGPPLPDISVLGEGTGMMEWNMDNESMVTFGMEFTKSGLQAAAVSPIAKLFYDEHPGFYYKSCFSLVAKFKNLPVDIRKTMDDVYKCYFGDSYAALQNNANHYLSYLQSLGVPLEDIYDKYSPSNALIYGDFVDADPMNQTQVVPQEHYINVFHHFKDLSLRALEMHNNNIRKTLGGNFSYD